MMSGCIVWLINLVLSAGSSSMPPTATEAAYQLGLAPESLLVANAGSQATSILQALDGAEETRIALQQAIDAHQALLAELTELVNAAASSISSSEVHAALASQRTAVDNAWSAVESRRAELFSAATANLSEQVVSTIQAWTRSAPYQIPEAYRGLDLTEAELRSLARAVRHKHRADRLGESIDSGVQQLLNGLASDLNVIAAGQRLESQLSTVENAFTGFTGE